MFGLGIGELLVLFLIILIFVGPKKLPELAKGLGKGVREFQKASRGITDSFQAGMTSDTEQYNKPEVVTEKPLEQVASEEEKA